MQQFEHQAMATQFLLTIAQEYPTYAEGAALRCFARLDELELKLSRFVADSDISRMNKLKAGADLLLDYETWDVFKKAIQVQQWTEGAFDIGVAEHMNIFRAGKQGILNAYEMTKALQQAQQDKLAASLYVDPEQPRFYCVQTGMQFDLGGIGKGYAVDELANILADMDIHHYSINAGDSTILTRGNPDNAPYWSYTITNAAERHQLKMTDIVVSASGTFHQGNHIFDPRTGQNTTVSTFDRIWVACDEAAYADAFSTGLFLLSVPEIEALVSRVSAIKWVAYSQDNQHHFLGQKDLLLV